MDTISLKQFVNEAQDDCDRRRTQIANVDALVDRLDGAIAREDFGAAEAIVMEWARAYARLKSTTVVELMKTKTLAELTLILIESRGN